MKTILFTILMLITSLSQVQAVYQNTSSGTVASVRTYQVGTNGLRAQITLSTGTHVCGTQPSVFYFDSQFVSTEVVDAVLSLAFGAMVAGKPVVITYDCSFGGGGYGWGFAISVSN